MNFKQHWKSYEHLENKVNGNIIYDMSAASWDMCKKEILSILKCNIDLESEFLSHYSGKKVYKIYGSVIDEIEKL